MGHDDRMRAFYDDELPTRAGLRVGSPRPERLEEFVHTCRSSGRRSVLEIGASAGHDGAVLRAAGLRYTGVDLSVVGVGLCRMRGLDAMQASATALPFATDSFDAACSMSTLVHLPGEDILMALQELRRAVRPGGLLKVGVWGADGDGVFIDDKGRHFRQRTDPRVAKLDRRPGRL